MRRRIKTGAVRFVTVGVCVAAALAATPVADDLAVAGAPLQRVAAEPPVPNDKLDLALRAVMATAPFARLHSGDRDPRPADRREVERAGDADQPAGGASPGSAAWPTRHSPSCGTCSPSVGARAPRRGSRHCGSSTGWRSGPARPSSDSWRPAQGGGDRTGRQRAGARRRSACHRWRPPGRTSTWWTRRSLGSRLPGGRRGGRQHGQRRRRHAPGPRLAVAGWHQRWYDPYGQHPSTPIDVSGHGTMTMGVMVGGDVGGTAVGVAPDARWIAVKMFNDQGYATMSAIHLSFQWLLDPDRNPGHGRLARRGEQLLDLLVARLLPHVPARCPGPQGRRHPARLLRRQLWPRCRDQPQPGELPRVVRRRGYRRRRQRGQREQPGARRLRRVIGHVPRPRGAGRRHPHDRHLRPLCQRNGHLVRRPPCRRGARPPARRLRPAYARRAGCGSPGRSLRPRHPRSGQLVRVRPARRDPRLRVAVRHTPAAAGAPIMATVARRQRERGQPGLR